MFAERRSSEIPLLTSTAVKRRETLPTMRQSNNEWTAARCHRLLRPLTSRIAILEKEISRFPSVNRPCKRRLHGDDYDAHDFEDRGGHWARQKRIKRTYSGKAGRRKLSKSCSEDRLPKSTKEKNTVPGEIVVPTPILSRSLQDHTTYEAIPFMTESHSCTNSQKRDAMKSNGKTAFQGAEALRGIRKITSPARFSIYEGLYNGLEALLKGTRLDSGTRECARKGPNTLMSMCLKTAPKYIMAEEKRIFAENKETGNQSFSEARDASAEIYDELESLGCSSHGYTQYVRLLKKKLVYDTLSSHTDHAHFRLRIVVRYHGIRIISDVIEAGVLEIGICEALIDLCVHFDALDEAKVLLTSLLRYTPFPPPTSVHSRFGHDRRLQPLSMLRRFVENTGLTSFQYRQLSILISSGSLPLTWLATREFQHIWTGLMQKLSQETSIADCLKFLNAVLTLLRSSSSKHTEEGDRDLYSALRNTFTSVLITLSAMTILSRSLNEDGSSGAKARRHIHLLLESCVTDFDPLLKLNTSPEIWSKYVLLLAANLLVADRETSSDWSLKLMNRLLVGLKPNPNKATGRCASHDYLAHFISSVARCCGRGASNTGFEHLKQLHQTLNMLMIDKTSDGAVVLHEIIMDSAFDFAQHSLDRTHLDYAAAINAELHGTKQDSFPLPGRNTANSRSGFRWEEGISEWIAATPDLNVPKYKNSMELLDEDSECDTPIRAQGRKCDRMPSSPANGRRLRLLKSNHQNIKLPGIVTPNLLSSNSCKRPFLEENTTNTAKFSLEKIPQSKRVLLEALYRSRHDTNSISTKAVEASFDESEDELCS